jgi:hypothetical protein
MSLASSDADNLTPTGVTTCFQHKNAFGCIHPYTPSEPTGLSREQLMGLVERGRARCTYCGRDSDLRAQIRDFPVFGIPEALFGLDVWHGAKEIPPSSEHRIVWWDIGIELPHEGNVLYANTTAQSDDPSTMGPRLLAQQNSHAPWPLQLAIYAPASSKKAALSLVFVMTPEVPLEPALDLAVQAVGQLHRHQLNVACVLLAAAVETSLRTRLEAEYAARGVDLDNRTPFAQLLERARMVLEPAPGPKLVGELNALTKSARNPAAHGQPIAVTREQVSEWMVDVAVVYEWTKLATSVHVKPGPPVASRSGV